MTRGRPEKGELFPDLDILTFGKIWYDAAFLWAPYHSI